jgi:hypothetical protein
MISQIVTATSSSGTWAAQPWQAPVAGRLVGINLSYRVTIAAGAGADIAVYAAVFASNYTGQTSAGNFIGATGTPPNICYAILIDSANELAATAQHLAGAIYVPQSQNLAATQQLFISSFCDSTIHGCVVCAVIQFVPLGER